MVNTSVYPKHIYTNPSVVFFAVWLTSHNEGNAKVVFSQQLAIATWMTSSICNVSNLYKVSKTYELLSTKQKTKLDTKLPGLISESVVVFQLQLVY